MSGMPQCSRAGCGRPIILARTIPGEQTIPLDPEPTPAGHYEVDWDALPVPTARRVRSGNVAPAVAAYLGNSNDALYIHHAETCRALNAPPSTDPSGTTDAPSAAASGP